MTAMQTKSEYLKKMLDINVPATLIIKKRVGQYPEKDFETKQLTGHMETLYIFEKSGIECRHYAKESEEETLRMFAPGQQVICTRREVKREGKPSYFVLDWTEPGDIFANAPVQTMKNTAIKTQEKKQDAYQDEQKEKDIRICLQGFMQAYITAHPHIGTIENLPLALDALTFAVEARRQLTQKAKELANPAPTEVPPAPDYPF
jgi:hypothetical protein